MKKLIIVASAIILTSIILYGAYSLFLKQTPEKILKTVFDISLKNFDYTIESFEEQWCPPHGDGQVLIVIKFNKLTQENIDYFKNLNNIQSLPISEIEYQQMIPNEIPNQFFKLDAGYYIYEPSSLRDLQDYKLFVIDTDKKMAFLYYQCM